MKSLEDTGAEEEAEAFKFRLTEDDVLALLSRAKDFLDPK
jgi:hypothetical protein